MAFQANFKVPVPALQPLQDSPTDLKDVREWMLSFELYLDRVEDNQPQGQQLGDRQKNGLLCSHLGQEGLRSFSRTPFYEQRHNETHANFRQQVISHFKKTPNQFRARYDFHRRDQLHGESVLEFMTALRSMAIDCAFPNEDDAIKHQLVSGSLDTKAQLEIFASQDPLDLNAVVSKLRASEAASRDQKGIGERRFLEARSSPAVQLVKQQRCTGCGSTCHRRFDPSCRALGKTCSNCGRPNHFAAVCQSKATPSTSQPRAPRGRQFGAGRRNRGRGSRGRPQNPPNQQGTLKLDDFTVQCCTVSKDAKSIKKFWVKTVSGRYTPVTFQVDTGADTTLISSEVFTDQFPQFKLKQLAARLSSVDGTPIKGHKGTFTTRICFGGRTSIGDLHVVSGIKNNILGRNFLRPLAVQIDCSSDTIAAIQVSKEELLKEFPQLIDDNMGTYQGTPHRIQLSPNAIPFATRLRPIPLALREAAIKEAKEMDRLGVWKPVDHSDWAHPMVTVPKKTGGARITTDLTKLNNFVVPERFPLPRIKDLICNLSGSTVFSKLDLKKGYFHIPLHPDSQPLTITITPLGLRMYTRLPMGLKDSASAFQKRVQEALQGLPGVEPYIDDIVVHGKNTEEHDMRLRGVLSRLQNKGFKLQISKVSIGQHQVAAFGFLISANGVKPDPANVKPILDAPIPATVKQVQRFLGMVNYFSEFLPDVASLAEPLRKLTRSEEKYNWGATQELAFNTIKQALAHLAELQIFDPTADIIVTTDASDIGIGAMLSQRLPDQKEKPVAFFSKTLSPAERNYAASEKEALAAIRACEHWEHLIWGQPFTLRTDHQALRQILSSSKDRRQSSKFQRWKERLDEFNFKIEYLPGPDNAPADYLSRLESRAEELGLKSKDLTVAGIRMEQIQDLTSLDEELQAVIKALQTGQWKKLQIPDVAVLQSYIRIKEHLSFKDGILFQGRKIIPPVELRRPILEAIHTGHPGIVRTKNSLRTTYWWPGADRQVESLIKNCQPCQLSSKTAKTPTPKGISIPRPSKAGEQWALDITGPFYNGQYLVVLIDYYSRFPELLQTKDISSNSIIKWLEDLWDRIGNPTALVSDNGPQFVSQAFTDFLQSRDIHHFTTSVYNPQENGLVEVFNRYLKHGIQTFAQNNWTQGLKNLLLSYRTTPGDTGRSPADLFFGRIIRPSWKPNLQKPRRRTRKQQHFDTAHRTSLPLHKPHQGYSVFKKGDKVLKRIPWAPKGISPWKGPFIVERVLGTYTFLLSDGQVWSSRNLKPWIQSRVPADQWVDDDLPPFVGDLPPHLQPPIPVLRRSTRANQGRPPKRYACERLTGG